MRGVKDDEAERRGSWVPDNNGPDLPALGILRLIGESRKGNPGLFNVSYLDFLFQDSAKPKTKKLINQSSKFMEHYLWSNIGWGAYIYIADIEDVILASSFKT